MARTVLIPGAGNGAGNNLVRSLRAGDPALGIVGAHDDPFALRLSTADRRYLTPAPTDPGYAAALRRVVAAERVDLVIPNDDTHVRVVCALREALGCRVFLPSKAVVELCQDKYALAETLRARGVPAPATCLVEHRDDVARVATRLGGDRLWCRLRVGSGSRGAVPITRPSQARAWIAYWEDVRGVPPGAFTLSEYLPGRDFACQSLWKDGRLVLVKTAERLAYFGAATSVSGTSSVAAVAKTVREPRVVDVAVAAIRALDACASGAFSVDLKEDARGVPCVTEINAGRFITMMPLFDLTGAHNMAATYVRLALDEPVAVEDPYDAPDDGYFVRDVDTPPVVVRADALAEGLQRA